MMVGKSTTRRGMRRIAVLAAIVVAACIFAPALLRAEEARAEISQVQVGFGGKYKVGLWTPVVVTLKGGKTATTGHLQLIVADGDGLPSRVPSSKPYLVAAGETVTAMLFIKPGRIEAELEVAFFDSSSG